MDKKELRSYCRNIIKCISPVQFQNWGKAAYSLVSETEMWKNAKTVFVYVSLPTEIDTSPFINGALMLGKRLCVPKITGNGTMTAVEITDISQLRKGTFGISEPTEDCLPICKNEIDLILLPCLAADINGCRLGKGGGYYDRFCADFNGKKIIICPEALLLEKGKIPVEAWDIIIDSIVTEKRFIDCKQVK
jgi:5-formyltetrahydrofolate cyclo-ligase